jgi:hypothetical protein
VLSLQKLLLLNKHGSIFKERVTYTMTALPFEIIEVGDFTRSVAVLRTG